MIKQNGKKMGILMLDTTFLRVPGDVGNPESYPFQIVKKVIAGAKAKNVVQGSTAELLEPFIEGARELEAEGVQAITTSCGFLARFQKELSDSVRIPIFTSSLLQIRYLYPLLGNGARIGVMAADSRGLTEQHIEGAGIEGIPIVVYGMEGTYFDDVFVNETKLYDREIVEREVVERAKAMVREHPDIRAVVLECTVMPPYARAIQEAVGLPVYDITTLACYAMSGFCRSDFQ